MNCQTLWITFNGEIYNFKELRDELEGQGYSFFSGTDTEVVLKAYHAWGLEAFTRFNGDWALAIYDEDSKKILLCRDRYGVKPLYYSKTDDLFAFASEIKFFSKLFSLTPDNHKIWDYLRKNIIDHSIETIVKEVDQLLPSQYLILDTQTFEMHTGIYWRATDYVNDDQIRQPDYAQKSDELRELFKSAVSLREISDVPVGALLSGGVDSTAIVAVMDQTERYENNTLHTYSAIFDDPDFSEHEDIYKTLPRFKHVQPHFIKYKAEDVEKYIRKVLWHQDIPFRSLANLSQYLLYKRIDNENKLTVVLTGQGADELFGGYTEYLISNIVSLLLDYRPLSALTEIKCMHTIHKVSYPDILKNSLVRVASQIFSNYKKNGATEEGLNNHLLIQLISSLTVTALPEYLRYEDRNSLAFGKESRLPFLDHRLVEFALGLPNEFKIKDCVKKRILRDATSDYLPPHIRHANIKRGFISPQVKWQQTSKMKEWINERQTLNNIECKSLIDDVGTFFDDPYRKWRLALINEWFTLKDNY